MTDPQVWVSFFTLAALEVVLGIDNLIFVALVADRLPPKQRHRARRVGLSLALILRVGMLAGIAWIVGLTTPIFSVSTFALSWRDVILLGGGLFLLAKATTEIHHHVEGQEGAQGAGKTKATFAQALFQIVILDVIFSLDSVITAVGMATQLPIMIAAVITAVAVMLWSSEPLGRFVSAHPTVKLLALSFLLLVGVALVADGLHFHIPKGYLYFSIAFSTAVEGLNLLARKKRTAT